MEFFFQIHDKPYFFMWNTTLCIIFKKKNCQIPKRFISEWRDLKAVLRTLRHRVFTENPKLRSILEGIQKSLPL